MKKGMKVGCAWIALCMAGAVQSKERSVLMEERVGPDLSVVTTPEWLQLGGALEVEGYYGQSEGECASDLLLATVEFSADAQLTTNVGLYVGVLWEQYDREDDLLDQAYLVLGDSDEIPFYLQAGKMYLPFGNFESVFITDPLTLELGEINKTAVQVGMHNEVIQLHAAIFRGIVREGSTEPEDQISDGVLSGTIQLGPITAGAYWISDIMETDGQVAIGEEAAADTGFAHIGGAGGFVRLALGPMVVNAECLSALDSYSMGGASYTPMAYHLEASVLLKEDYTVGVRIEGSDDLYSTYDRPRLGLGDKYAGEQVGAVVAWAVNAYLTVSGEYLHAQELDHAARADVVSVQMALAF